MRGVSRLRAGLARASRPLRERLSMPGLDRPAAQMLRQGRQALAQGDRVAAMAAFARAVEQDGRALVHDWGLMPVLASEGRDDLALRMQARLAAWYGRDTALRAPEAAQLTVKLRMRAWAARHGFAVPRLLAQAPSLEALVWAGLPCDRVVIKPANADSRKGVVLALDGYDHMARQPIGPDLPAYVRTRWDTAGLSGSAVLAEEPVRDTAAQADPDLVIPRDFKCWAVDGKVGYCAILDINDANQRRDRQNLDRCGGHLPQTNTGWQDCPHCPAPPGYAALIAEAERASRLLPWMLRFDFYLSERGPLLGEITTFPSAGLAYTEFSRRVVLQMLELHPD